MGRSSDMKQPRKGQGTEYRAKEQLELIHTDIAEPFVPMAIEGKGNYNLVIVDDSVVRYVLIRIMQHMDKASSVSKQVKSTRRRIVTRGPVGESESACERFYLACRSAFESMTI